MADLVQGIVDGRPTLLSPFVPLVVNAGETWLLPKDRQAVNIAQVIDVDGVMALDGLLDDLSAAG